MSYKLVSRVTEITVDADPKEVFKWTFPGGVVLIKEVYESWGWDNFGKSISFACPVCNGHAPQGWEYNRSPNDAREFISPRFRKAIYCSQCFNIFEQMSDAERNMEIHE